MKIVVRRQSAANHQVGPAMDRSLKLPFEFREESLHPNVRGLRPSATIAIDELANELRAEGREVFKLGLGQSPFPVPETVVEALRENAFQKDYLPSAGLSELRESVARHHRREFGMQCDAEDVVVGLISNAQGDRGELLQWVLHAVGEKFDPAASYVQLFQHLQEYLLEAYAQGHRVILIIDEAQNLNLNTLEELRMLTNINSNKDELVQLVLVGQPELRRLITRPELKQFVQRVGSSFHLAAMSADNVGDYIGHRLRVAGGSGDEFTPEAVERVHALTGGIPRLINQLCDLGLVYAFSSDEAQVTRSTIEGILADGVFFGAGSLKGDCANES